MCEVGPCLSAAVLPNDSIAQARRRKSPLDHRDACCIAACALRSVETTHRTAGTLTGMSTALLLVPDFLLIVCGFCLCRYSTLDRPVWEAAEKLVYYLLFPVLLCNSVVRSPLRPGETLSLALAGMAVLALGIGLAFAVRSWPGVDARLHASGAQVAFRFNSFIALALAERLGGTTGVTWMALLLAVGVAICKVAAVWTLARGGGQW